MFKHAKLQYKILMAIALLASTIITFCSQKYLQEATRQDIDFIRATILENHPGVYNDQDPTFVSDLSQFYQTALASIEHMHKSCDHLKIVNEFLKSFHDTHLRCDLNQQSKRLKKQHKKHAQFSLKVDDNVAWVVLPTFAPDAQGQVDLQCIIDQIPACTNNAMIVFDVRANTGGNDAWAEQLVEALFTPEYAKFHLYQKNKNIVVNWRASESNTHYLVSLLALLEQQFGASSSMLMEFQTVLEGIMKSQERRKPLYAQKTMVQSFKNMNSKNPVTAKIVVIIDHSCVSACLDFIDMLKALSCNVTLIGETTDADTVYMEVRMVDLPSGIGRLQFPIKMYRNRARGHNQPYIPDIPFPAHCTKKKDVECWIVQTVKNLTKEDHRGERA